MSKLWKLYLARSKTAQKHSLFLSRLYVAPLVTYLWHVIQIVLWYPKQPHYHVLENNFIHRNVISKLSWFHALLTEICHNFQVLLLPQLSGEQHETNVKRFLLQQFQRFNWILFRDKKLMNYSEWCHSFLLFYKFHIGYSIVLAAIAAL